MKRRQRRGIFLAGIIAVLLLWSLWYVKYAGHHATLERSRVPSDFWGVTFSKTYASELDLDWREAYLAILDDLKVKLVRLPVYWNDIERSRDAFDFSEYDWMLEEGAKRGVRFILVVGRRLPRWPECHQPSWVHGWPEKQVKEEHLAMTREAIMHFKEQEAIQWWQLENEYFFPWFGLCPKADLDLIRREMAFLRSKDSRPLILTDSGELNSWRTAAANADILGITIYRVVWNNYFGYFRWPWPAALYRFKARIAGKSPSDMMVAELQAEPWPAGFKKVSEISAEEASRSFTVRQLETNSEIARRTGFTRALYWGVEWWYWMKQRGEPEVWNSAREIIQYGQKL